MSDLRVATISDVAGTGPVDLYMQNATKVWVRWNTSVFGIDGSFNVSSITDQGTGKTDINFTTDLATSNYAGLGLSNNRHAYDSNAPTTGSFQITTLSSSHSASDGQRNYFTANGDLA
jgi:hypothetical protein